MKNEKAHKIEQDNSGTYHWVYQSRAVNDVQLRLLYELTKNQKLLGLPHK